MSTYNTGNTQAPPQHPASGTGATTTGVTPHTVNDGSQGAAAANSIGQKISGAFGVAHGAGEGIRGNINSFLDNAGEQIAGRGQEDVKPATRTDGGERPAHVAAKGADEFEAGVAKLKQ